MHRFVVALTLLVSTPALAGADAFGYTLGQAKACPGESCHGRGTVGGETGAVIAKTCGGKVYYIRWTKMWGLGYGQHLHDNEFFTAVTTFEKGSGAYIHTLTQVVNEVSSDPSLQYLRMENDGYTATTAYGRYDGGRYEEVRVEATSMKMDDKVGWDVSLTFESPAVCK